MKYYTLSFKVGVVTSLFSSVGLSVVDVVPIVRRHRERKPQG